MALTGSNFVLISTFMAQSAWQPNDDMVANGYDDVDDNNDCDDDDDISNG